ncbi:hypothetical protein Geob_3308 [Geotalea daltonii FRC-32]|uniref:IgGFc-binding protein N-terminal domain-containing protein n=1 Tax=Geotalea daltonii (strain DSM 22248 / JCM 15807 / FRC-32) TaxID=316067 RepID=B9M4W7_GEODF|nr:IgGFc-binding protein [Geotalea daltonii]ACM21651.1 hypothetical protein Geob_3308 [Geotalea daltonii FRC-32]
MRATQHTLKFLFSAFFALLLTMPVASRAASDSSGKDFYFAFQENYTNTSNLALFITGKEDTQGVVEIAGINFSTTFTVVANQVTTISIPESAQRLGSNVVARLGIHVTAQKEVTIYALNQRTASTDAFLALPTDILGLEYIAMSYNGLNIQYEPSQVAVVGAYDNTEVTITPSNAADGRAAGVPYTIRLNRGDTYEVRGSGTADLTGTIVTATAPVSVMSGVQCVNVPVGYWACDHIVEMMPPVATWGKSFLTVPLATRLKGDPYRILASQDDTKVYINGALAATINRGRFFEKILTARSQIEASAPVLVSQYSAGQDFDGVVSDPFMMLIPPTEQFLNQYTFSTPSGGFSRNYVNVVVPTSSVSSLLLDGTPVNAALFSPVGSSGFSGGQVPISLGSHTITGSVPFGIYVYGFGSYDSYGYPGGMAYEFINPMGDTYAPNVRLNQINDTIWGTATDSEDINANGVLDAGEDLNGNGVVDRRSEDVNGNGKLDAGEDLNGNGYLDRDTGVFKIELEPGANNLKLTTLAFVPGALSVGFSVTLIDSALPGSGLLRVTDGVGNEVLSPITLSLVPTLTAVRIIDTVSTKDIQVDTNSFTKAPYSVTNLEDTTVIEWRYDSFPADLSTDIAFDVILKNPVPGEQRLVTHKVELLYNAVNGQPVRTELGSLLAQVLTSAFETAIATDKPSYGPNADALVSATVKNVGQYQRSVDVKILIEDAMGNVLGQETRPAVPFAVGTPQSFTVTYNTGTSYPGDYRAHLLLLDNGKQVGESFAPFKVTPERSATSNISSDKAAYVSYQPVVITSTIRSTSPNYVLQDLTARVTVTDSAGNKVFSDDKVIKTLLQGQSTDLRSDWNSGSHAKGKYMAQLEVSDASGLLTTSSTAFDILGTSATGVGVSGTITAQPSPVYQGLEEKIAYTVTNTGNEDLFNLALSIVIADAVTMEVKQTLPASITLPMGATSADNLTVSTAGLNVGTYAAFLKATLSGSSQTKTLARANFEVVVPVKPKLEVTKAVSGIGNVLVWLDYPWTSGQNCPERPPVERALREAGVLYTIVTDKKDFEREIRNQIYTDYLILGDQLPTEDHFSEELREQVNRGKGLISSPFTRNNLNEAMFGIKTIGVASGSDYLVELASSPISAAGSLQSYGRSIKVEAVNPAEVVGWITEVSNNKPTRYPAVIVRQYGLGNVVFLGFDLGMTSRNYDAFAQLLTNAFRHIHQPASTVSYGPGQMVPVELTVKSLADEFSLKISESYPAGVRLFDPASGQWITDNPWVYNLMLMPDEKKTMLYYAQLPVEKGEYTLESSISYSVDGIWDETGRYAVAPAISSDTAESIDIVRMQLANLYPLTNEENANVATALTAMSKVTIQASYTVIELDAIIHELLKAIGAMVDIHTVDTAPIRRELDKLLVSFSGRWYQKQ